MPALHLLDINIEFIQIILNIHLHINLNLNDDIITNPVILKLLYYFDEFRHKNQVFQILSQVFETAIIFNYSIYIQAEN